MTEYNGKYLSSDGVHSIAYTVFTPDTEPLGVVQISHGMCEYFGRYKPMAEYLTERGFVVCGNDHLGHGDSVNDESELGWFGGRDGWQNAVEDLHSLTLLMKEKYPELPYFMFGHSMGSFLARAYATRHGKKLDGAVFCGTSGGIKGAPALLSLVDSLITVHGSKYRSETVDKLAFGAYNAKISDSDNRYDWISRDKEVVERFAADPKCNFTFTLNGFDNLARVLWYVSDDKWFESYPKALPTYLLAGNADPVGNYGKGVLKVYRRLSAADCNVEMKIYDGARHELMNEFNKDEFFCDVTDFLMSVIQDKNSTENCTESE